MELKYKNTLDDYVGFSLYCYKFDPKLKLRYNIIFYGYQIFLLIATILFCAQFDNINEMVPIFLINMIAWIIWICFAHKIQKKMITITIKRNFVKKTFMSSEKVLSINEDRISIKNDEMLHEFNFGAILKVAKCNNRIYIIFKKGYSSSGTIIPFSAFSNINEKERFFELIKIHCQ